MFACPRLQCTLQHTFAIKFDIYFYVTVDKYERRAAISCNGGTNHHHGRSLSSSGQPKRQIFSWPLWQVNTINFIVYKLLDNEWFHIGENQIRRFTTFGQPKQLFGSYESNFLCASVRSYTFWIFNDFTPSSFLIFAEWHITICSVHESFFDHCTVVSEILMKVWRNLLEFHTKLSKLE